MSNKFGVLALVLYGLMANAAAATEPATDPCMARTETILKALDAGEFEHAAPRHGERDVHPGPEAGVGHQHEGAQDEQFVGEGVHDPAEARDDVPLAGQEPVEGVGERGQHEEDEGGDQPGGGAKGGVGLAVGRAGLGQSKADKAEDREADPREGEGVGDRGPARRGRGWC